jgi:hypothetical protein
MGNTYRTFVLIWLPRRELFKLCRMLATAGTETTGWASIRVMRS